ncbi:PREDICTED: uncharacterized protein LOC104799190 [Tarenaya hassleriana]|uniref:uncharacterized protein LOC104799190 n=1 Tax=Tarenaya hassleriana TaxID=28532 RepID=UPI00053C9BBB|nr:PREDICTED: uncharacterized protein LOC104799190 [Tarenaya hassleriana]
MNGLQRTVSDISFEITKDDRALTGGGNNNNNQQTTTFTALSTISEVEDAKCECCGMSEECTPEYIRRVRSKFSGKLICGLCSKAAEEEMEKMSRNDGADDAEKRWEEAVRKHMSACSKFNRLGRSYPALYQAEAVKAILKKKRSSSSKAVGKGGGLSRSSSCMPAIAKELDDRTMVN